MIHINLQAYVKGSVEAVEFYKEAFGATLGNNLKGSDGTFIHKAWKYNAILSCLG